VRGIHESDNAVIDGAWQLGREMRDLVFVAESRDTWSRHRRLRSFGETSPGGRGLRDEDPDVVLVLFAGVAAGVDAVNF
jgi:hypothetical protein